MQSEHQGFHARTRAEGQCGASIVFHSEIQKLVAAHHSIMEGWDEVLQSEHAQGCRDPVVARNKVPGGGRAARESRAAVDRILRRFEPVGGRALSRRPVGRRWRESHTRGEKARARRRSGDVERIHDSRNHRQPHLAAHRCDCGTVVVRAGCARCEFDVFPDGRYLRQAQFLWSEASIIHTCRCCSA